MVVTGYTGREKGLHEGRISAQIHVTEGGQSIRQKEQQVQRPRSRKMCPSRQNLGGSKSDLGNKHPICKSWECLG